jgi:hypothetical protein
MLPREARSRRVSAAVDRPLHIVKSLDPAREEGGECREPYGVTAPWVRLSPGPFWVTVKGWRIAPQRFGWRKPRRGGTEREADWRCFLHGSVVSVPDEHPAAPSARSEVFRYKLDRGDDPWLPIVLRFTVTEKSHIRIVPAGGHLWELLAMTGQRGAALTAEVLDALLGWTLLVETRVPTHHRVRPGQHRGSPIAHPLQHSWGYAVSEAKPPKIT